MFLGIWLGGLGVGERGGRWKWGEGCFVSSIGWDGRCSLWRNTAGHLGICARTLVLMAMAVGYGFATVAP